MVIVSRLQVQIDKMKEIHELEINSMQTAYQNKFKVKHPLSSRLT